MKKNILLVDDDKATNLIHANVARSIPFIKDIYKVANGYEALQFFKGTDNRPIPDIVVLNLQMPVMGGFEFLEVLQTLNFPGKEKIVFIIVTSSDERDDIIRAKSLGVKYFLTKPVSGEKIRSIILAELGIN